MPKMLEQCSDLKLCMMTQYPMACLLHGALIPQVITFKPWSPLGNGQLILTEMFNAGSGGCVFLKRGVRYKLSRVALGTRMRVSRVTTNQMRVLSFVHAKNDSGYYFSIYKMILCFLADAHLQ